MELPTRWMALVCQTAHVRALHCHPSTASRSARVQSCSLLQSRRTPVTTPESHQLMGIRFALANAMAPGPESRRLFAIRALMWIVASMELALMGCANVQEAILIDTTDSVANKPRVVQSIATADVAFVPFSWAVMWPTTVCLVTRQMVA